MEDPVASCEFNRDGGCDAIDYMTASNAIGK